MANGRDLGSLVSRSGLLVIRHRLAPAENDKGNGADDDERSDDDADGDARLGAGGEAITTLTTAGSSSSSRGRANRSSGFGLAGSHRARLGWEVELGGGDVEAGDLQREGGSLDEGLRRKGYDELHSFGLGP
jgi:hypothetical protein